MRLPRGAALALLVLVLALAPLVLSEFQVIQMNYIGMAVIIALGLVMLTGVAGVMSFGQQVFAGIAAYTTAVLSTEYGASPWMGLMLALVLAAIGSTFLGAITLRLSGHYLPIATIAWGMAIYFAFGNLEILGKHTGIANIPPIGVGSVPLDTPFKVYWLIWIVLLLLLLACSNLLDSRTGRAMRALRARAVMAESFGVNAYRLKTTVFLLAALLAALSGWLYAHFLGFVSPGAFNVHAGIDYLFMVLLGGAGSVWGALIGGGLMTLLKDGLATWLPSAAGTSGNYAIVALGAVIMLVLHRTTAGLAPVLARWTLRPERFVPPRGGEPLRRRAPPTASTLLQVAHARKRFGGLAAVDELSFEVRRGEILGLVGPNGAGKSTMFDIISGVARCDSGEVHFLGERIDRDASSRIARRGIARTFQHVNLVGGMTVLDNVAIGAYLRGRRGAVASMVRADRAEERRLLSEAATQLERVGLPEHLHDRAGSLPLGKQRLVEIARALCADPLLLLLDEPAAGLRHAEKRALAALLGRLRANGMSILIVEHDMDFVMGLVDRLVVMKLGQLLATGSPSAIQGDPAVIEAYLGSAA